MTERDSSCRRCATSPSRACWVARFSQQIRTTTVPELSGVINEDTYAEQPALEWLTGLRGLKWEHAYGPEIAPNGAAPERTNWDDVVLVDRLRAAVVDLNPDAPREAAEDAIGRVLGTDSPEPLRDHLAFHELLVQGTPVTVLVDGE